MMRPLPTIASPLLLIFMLAFQGSTADAAQPWLESVSIIRAGGGSSLAAKTSAIPVLVAATSIDSRTVVIELVGIVAERRAMAVTDSAGMISRIAIETAGPAGGGAVTRIRIVLARPFRHRVRASGHLVYVDFERPRGEGLKAAALPRPQAPNVTRPEIAAQPRAPEKPTHTAPDDTRLLSRWLSIAEPLQHTFDPPSPATVLGREWIPLVLNDGATIFSHGDFAVIDDHFVFLLPLDNADSPRVEAVAVQASAIDRHATMRAADSVRAARYALTLGPREFADLSESVSANLNAIPSETDPVARVRLAERVRQQLVEWPGAHHGYRARDIFEAVSTLDPILNQLRVAAGVNRVDLSLAALSDSPHPAMTFRHPTLVDFLENAMRLVFFLMPSQRTPVLQATADSLKRHRTELPSVWFATGQRRVAAALETEIRADQAYRKLSARIIERAVRAARDGNVRAIASLQSELLARDRKLGGTRQDVVVSAMATLQTQFDLAVRERLRREHQTIEPALDRRHSDEPAKVDGSTVR